MSELPDLILLLSFEESEYTINVDPSDLYVYTTFEEEEYPYTPLGGAARSADIFELNLQTTTPGFTDSTEFRFNVNRIVNSSLESHLLFELVPQYMSDGSVLFALEIPISALAGTEDLWELKLQKEIFQVSVPTTLVWEVKAQEDRYVPASGQYKSLVDIRCDEDRFVSQQSGSLAFNLDLQPEFNLDPSMVFELSMVESQYTSEMINILW